MKKTALLFLIGLLLVACAPRGVLQLVRGADVGEIREIYVASNRVERYENSVNFSAERGDKLSFARLDVSVPPGHRDGQIELPPSGAADPARHFVLSGAYVKK